MVASSTRTWRPPPSRTTGEFVPTRVRIEAPLFNGDDPLGWIFGIQDYFNYFVTDESVRLAVVEKIIEQPALDWFHNYQKSNMKSSWEDFLMAVHQRFAPEFVEDDVLHVVDGNYLSAQPSTNESIDIVSDVIGLDSLICYENSDIKSTDLTKAGNINANSTCKMGQPDVAGAMDAIIYIDPFLCVSSPESYYELDYFHPRNCEVDDGILQSEARHIRRNSDDAAGFLDTYGDARQKLAVELVDNNVCVDVDPVKPAKSGELISDNSYVLEGIFEDACLLPMCNKLPSDVIPIENLEGRGNSLEALVACEPTDPIVSVESTGLVECDELVICSRLTMPKGNEIAPVLDPIFATNVTSFASQWEAGAMGLSEFTVDAMFDRAMMYSRLDSNILWTYYFIDATTRKKFGWKEILIGYTDSCHGRGLVLYLRAILLKSTPLATQHSVTSSNIDQICLEFSKLMKIQLRAFLDSPLPNLQFHGFTVTKEVELMDMGCAWLISLCASKYSQFCSIIEIGGKGNNISWRIVRAPEYYSSNKCGHLVEVLLDGDILQFGGEKGVRIFDPGIFDSDDIDVVMNLRRLRHDNLMFSLSADADWRLWRLRQLIGDFCGHTIAIQISHLEDKVDFDRGRVDRALEYPNHAQDRVQISLNLQLIFNSILFDFAYLL